MFFKTRKVNGMPIIIRILLPELKDGKVISNELNNPEVGTKHADNIIELENEIHIVELQTGHTKTRDLYRFILYADLIRNDESYDVKKRKPIHIYIIYKDKINKIYEYKDDVFYHRFNPISLKDYNGDEIRERIKEKIEKGEFLTEDEIILFDFIPLLGSNKKTEKELLEIMIKLVNKDSNLTDNERQSIMLGQFLLAVGLSNENEEELRRWINMLDETDVMEIIQQGWKEDGIKIGIMKGRDEALNSVAKNMLKNNDSIEHIAKSTGLSIKQIEELKGK